MAIESTVNVNGKRSASDADLEIVDENTSKRVQAESQHIDHFIELRQRSVFGRYLDAVKFLIGPNAESFVLHTGLLIHRCPALAQAVFPEPIVTQRQDSTSLEIRLQRQDARCFWIFLVWLYTQELIRPPVGLCGLSEDGLERERESLPEQRLVSGIILKNDHWLDTDLIKVFLFGTRYGIHDLANAAISTLVAQNIDLRRTTSLAGIEVALRGITGKGILCRYLAEEAELQLRRTRCKKPFDEPTSDVFPREYRSLVEAELASGYSLVKTTLDQAISYSCRYHTHEGSRAQFACENDQDRAKPRSRFDAKYYNYLKEAGTVLVGHAVMPFVVHKGLFSMQSKYFRGAFQGHFAEAESGVIRLQNEDPALFIQVLHALYDDLVQPTAEDQKCFADLRAICAFAHDGEASSIDGGEASTTVSGRPDTWQRAMSWQHWQDNLINLYILCDRRDIPRLRLQIMELLATYTVEQVQGLCWSTDRIIVAWDNLPTSAGLCRFLVDGAAWTWDRSTKPPLKNLEHLPAQFLAKVMHKMLRYVRNANQLPWNDAPWQKDGADAYCEEEVDGRG